MGNVSLDVSDLKFDRVLQTEGTHYGILTGNTRIVFIKTGLGGNEFGREDKYLKMACRLRKRYGCSVIVASNPDDRQDHVARDIQAIEQYAEQAGMDTQQVLFFGNSNGCIKGLAMANAGMHFEKMVLVNMPLMINFHKTKRYLSDLSQTEIIAVYGERDPSYSYLPFLEGKAQHLCVLRVLHADHNFSGMLQEYLELSDLLMERNL